MYKRQAFGFHGLVWGFFVSTVFLFHGTFTVNSLNHVIGHRNYQTTDTSTNHWFLALITMGEGWHNNHHFYQRSTAQGWRWYEYDFSFYLLKVASWVGIAKGVSKPPQHVMQRTQKKVRQKAEGVLLDLLETASRTRELMKAKMSEYELEFGRKKEATQEAWAEKIEAMQAEMEALHDKAKRSIEAKRQNITSELDRFAEQSKESFERSVQKLDRELAELKESYYEILEQWRQAFPLDEHALPA